MRVLDEEESGNIIEVQRRSRHIVVNTVWAVIGHVRTGKWFSVLPRAVHAMIADAIAAGDDELEAIPLVRTPRRLKWVSWRHTGMHQVRW
jgi:hypothetical protein